MEELANEVLKELERLGQPVELYVFCCNFNANYHELFVALEFLFRKGKVAKFTRFRPTTDGVLPFDFWTTTERAREIEAAWTEGRRNVD